MTLLTDVELRTHLRATPPRILRGMAATAIDTNVMGCTINLAVGDIFRPGTRSKKPGSVERPRQRYSLGEGETAVIRTLESFCMGKEYASVVFPTSTVSMQGLLMTNPGHVDPGYHGHLHVTVINMGREPFPLERGQRFLRAMVFRLDGAIVSPISGNRSDPITHELLERLSPDLLSVASRASAAVRREVFSIDWRNRLWQAALPAVLAASAVFASTWVNNTAEKKDLASRLERLEKLDAAGRLTRLEDSVPTEKRISAAESKLDAMQQALQQKK